MFYSPRLAAMAPRKGTPAWIARMGKQRDTRAEARDVKFLSKAKIVAAVQAAKREERKRWAANLKAVQGELDAKTQRGNAHLPETEVLRKKLRHQEGLAKRWEESAEKHNRELRAVKKKLKDLEADKALLERKVAKYKAFYAFVDKWWWLVKCASDPSTFRKLTRLWRKGPKPPADGGWGGGQ